MLFKVVELEYLLLKWSLRGRERHIHLETNPALKIVNHDGVYFIRAIGRTAAPTLWCCASELSDLSEEEEEEAVANPGAASAAVASPGAAASSQVANHGAAETLEELEAITDQWSEHDLI